MPSGPYSREEPQQGCDGLAAGLRDFPRLPQGQWGAIRARILSRLLCEHEKEAARAHKASRAFEAPMAKSQMSPGLTPVQQATLTLTLVLVR